MLAVLGTAAIAGTSLPMAGCESSNRRVQPGQEARDLAEQRNEAVRLAQRAAERARAGDSEDAIALYEQSVRLSSDVPAAWNNLGTLRLADGDYASAVEAFKQAAALDPQDNRPLENIALAYSRVGWSRDALMNYERALEINPMSLTALRGSVQEANRLGLADNQTLDRVFRALTIETDDRWRTFFERQRFRVEAALRRPTPGSTTGGRSGSGGTDSFTGGLGGGRTGG